MPIFGKNIWKSLSSFLSQKGTIVMENNCKFRKSERFGLYLMVFLLLFFSLETNTLLDKTYKLLQKFEMIQDIGADDDAGK